MGCDIHLYVEKRLPRDLSLKNLARLAIRKARQNAEMKDLIEKQLESAALPQEMKEYVDEEPPREWVHVYEDQVVRHPVNDGDSDETYIELPSIYKTRSYLLFGWLAGVRGNYGGETIAEGRGAPADLSDSLRTNLEDWGPDAHSASWCTAQEALSWPGWAYTYEFKDGKATSRGESPCGRYFLDCIRKAVQDAATDAANVRIVFWFDN